MLADVIRPSGWHDFWFVNRSAGKRATTCCSGPLCQSRVQTNTHKPILWGKKGTDLTQHMESQWGLYKADRWHCPLYLQKTINPQASLP